VYIIEVKPAGPEWTDVQGARGVIGMCGGAESIIRSLLDADYSVTLTAERNGARPTGAERAAFTTIARDALNRFGPLATR
jgi:hypothetical protein